MLVPQIYPEHQFCALGATEVKAALEASFFFPSAVGFPGSIQGA